jgi:protein involved in polysaccharide export with SLBB domain
MATEQSAILRLRRRGLLTACLAIATRGGDTTPMVKEIGERLQLAPTTRRVAGFSRAPEPRPSHDFDYELGANDRLRITVFDQPTFTGEFALDGNGGLSFP